MKQCSTLIVRINLNGEDGEMSIEEADEAFSTNSAKDFLSKILPEYDVRQEIVDAIFRKIAVQK